MAVNKYCSVSYERYAVEGDEAPVLIEKTGREHCFEFITGLGFTLPLFENNVKDLAESSFLIQGNNYSIEVSVIDNTKVQSVGNVQVYQSNCVSRSSYKSISRLSGVTLFNEVKTSKEFYDSNMFEKIQTQVFKFLNILNKKVELEKDFK